MNSYSAINLLSLLLIFYSNTLIGQPINECDLQFGYRESGGPAEYNYCSKFGFIVIVKFDGIVEKYDIYFPNKYILRKTFKMSKLQFELFRSLFEEYEFNNYSNFPDDFILVNATDYVISYRPTKDSELRKIQIFGEADKKDLPDGYREFYNKFIELIRSI